MSSKSESIIKFKVRKSSRTTNRVNYSESCVNSEIDSKSMSKTSQLKSKDNKRSESKIKSKRHSDISDNEFNENEVKVSPTKIKKTFDQKNDFFISKTKQLLSPSIVDSLVGRDSECHQIKEWLTSNLESRTSASLYISGSAGTGKTLSVTHIMREIRQKLDFELITINCMTFRNANSIYSKILNELKHKKPSKRSDCLQTISDLLSDKKRTQMIVLVLDELDQLDTKSHDVLNTIFLWTKMSTSKLIIVGIANALDLTTRILSRIKSLNLSNIEEIHFKPYNSQQIVSIIEERIRRASDDRNIVITGNAIELCARKIESFSGDIRKALDVCRRAIDLVEKSDPSNRLLKTSNDDGFNTDSPKKSDNRSGIKCIDIPQIMSILNQIYGQKFESQSKKVLPFNQQIILCALLLFCKHKNKKEITLSECHQIFVNICTKRGISYNGKNESEFLSMTQLLEDYGFVSIKKLNQNIRNSKLSLRVNDSEIEHSLSDTQFLHSILQNSSIYMS